jgi:hypothetical protein
MLSVPEMAVLKVFRDFLVAPGEMLCFTGPVLDKHRLTLRQLTAKDLLVEEQFSGGYSLTAEGFREMRRDRPRKTAMSPK